MMAGRLRTFVHVHHDGGPTVFGPDDEVPAWAEKLITNPDAWAESSSQQSQDEAPKRRSPGRPPSSSKAAE
jgi:hypothetical protein